MKKEKAAKKAASGKNTKKSMPPVKIAVFAGVAALAVALIVIGAFALANRADKNSVQASANSGNTASTGIDFAENEAARFKEKSLSMEEFILYALPIASEYESIYTADIWEEEVKYENGASLPFETYLKCEIVDTVSCVKALAAKYLADGGTVSEEEEAQILSSAQTYYDTLAENGVEADAIGLTTIYGYMYENVCAEKEYVVLFGENADPEDDAIVDAVADIVAAFRGEDFTIEKNLNWKVLNLLTLGPKSEDDDTETIDLGELNDNVVTLPPDTEAELEHDHDHDHED